MKKIAMIYIFIFFNISILNAETLGDINYDGKVNVTEAIHALNTAAGFKSTITTTVKDNHSLDAIDGDPVDSVFVDEEGNVGVGTIQPHAKLHVNGEVKIGNSGIDCYTITEGSIRYNYESKIFEGCDGNRWFTLSMAPSSGINYLNNFDNSDILSSFIYKETSSSCDLKGLQDGGVVMYCPDNEDNVLYLEKFIIENYNNIHIEVDVYSWDWNDGAPRIGIDFDTSGSYQLNHWGPNEGYAFYFSDPLDELQGNLCSKNDTCPSITKSLESIIDIADVGTSKDKTYHLSIDMDNSGITFKVETDDNIVALMESDDTSYRTGHIGLHCSEGWCRFDNLKISLD